jgi:hypothetical protein
MSAIAPFLLGTVVLCGMAIWLRHLELPSFLVRAFSFAYAMFLAISALRYATAKQYLFHWLNGDAQYTTPVQGLPILICVVGVAFAGMIVAGPVVVWGLAQRIDRPKRDNRATAFLEFLSERKK